MLLPGRSAHVLVSALRALACAVQRTVCYSCQPMGERVGCLLAGVAIFAWAVVTGLLLLGAPASRRRFLLLLLCLCLSLSGVYKETHNAKDRARQRKTGREVTRKTHSDDQESEMKNNLVNICKVLPSVRTYAQIRIL